MPTVYDVLRSYRRATLIFDLADARAADATVAAFRRAGVEIGPGHGFAGPPQARARLRQLTGAGFVLDHGPSEACIAPYYRTGWLGIVSEACNGTILILSRHGSFTLWGWPYRFLARMSGAGARFFIAGDDAAGDRWVGLTAARATRRGAARLYGHAARRGHGQCRAGAGALTVFVPLIDFIRAGDAIRGLRTSSRHGGAERWDSLHG